MLPSIILNCSVGELDALTNAQLKKSCQFGKKRPNGRPNRMCSETITGLSARLFAGKQRLIVQQSGMLADAAVSRSHSMNALDEPCKAFGDFVEDVQYCTDPGTGLQQISTKGLTSLLAMRDIGYRMFGVTEGVKADAAKARDAFDEKTLVLQNLLYESGYYQKEIQEARDYKSAVSNADMELMSVEDFQQTADAAFTGDLEASSDSYEHKLMLKRLDHELQSRKQARQQLSELKARKDALQTNLGQKRKALTDLHKHAKLIKSSVQNVRKLLSLPDSNDQSQHQLAQLLPLPLYFIYSQATAILDTLSTLVRTEVTGSKEEAEVELAGDNKNALQPARKKQKRSASVGSTSDIDHYQVSPAIHARPTHCVCKEMYCCAARSWHHDAPCTCSTSACLHCPVCVVRHKTRGCIHY